MQFNLSEGIIVEDLEWLQYHGGMDSHQDKVVLGKMKYAGVDLLRIKIFIIFKVKPYSWSFNTAWSVEIRHVDPLQ